MRVERCALFTTLLLAALIGCGDGKSQSDKSRPKNAGAPKDLTVAPKAASDANENLPATRVVDLGGGVKMEFVLITSGSFTMGTENSSTDEKAHKVTITKPFYLGKFEVTQKQWQQVMGANPSGFKGEQNPVDRVSWNDGQEFLKKVNALVPGGGFRLPTESEWEYACRAGSTGDYAGTGKLDDMGWYGGNSENKTHPVGAKKPNAWGLFDMHGNVYEWCADWKGEYPAGVVTDPSGPEQGSSRVLRGGSWYFNASVCRSASRLEDAPVTRHYSYGFRVALGLE